MASRTQIDQTCHGWSNDSHWHFFNLILCDIGIRHQNSGFGQWLKSPICRMLVGYGQDTKPRMDMGSFSCRVSDTKSTRTGLATCWLMDRYRSVFMYFIAVIIHRAATHHTYSLVRNKIICATEKPRGDGELTYLILRTARVVAKSLYRDVLTKSIVRKAVGSRSLPSLGGGPQCSYPCS